MKTPNPLESKEDKLRTIFAQLYGKDADFLLIVISKKEEQMCVLTDKVSNGSISREQMRFYLEAINKQGVEHHYKSLAE